MKEIWCRKPAEIKKSVFILWNDYQNYFILFLCVYFIIQNRLYIYKCE